MRRRESSWCAAWALVAVVAVAAVAAARGSNVIMNECVQYSDTVQLCVEVDRTSCTTLNFTLLSNGEPYYERSEVDVGRAAADGRVDVACKRVAQVSNCFDCLVVRDLSLDEHGLDGCVRIEERCSDEVLSTVPFGCFSDGPCERPPGLGQYEETMFYGHYTNDWKLGGIGRFDLSDPQRTTEELTSDVDRVQSIAVDSVLGHIYAVDPGPYSNSERKLVRMTLSGENVTAIVGPTEQYLSAVAVSGNSGMLYWGIDGHPHNRTYLYEAPVGHPDQARRIELPAPSDSIKDMELDPSGRFLYLATRTSSCVCGHLFIYDTQMNTFRQRVITEGGPISIGLDYVQNVIYMGAYYNTFTVHRLDANLTSAPVALPETETSKTIYAVALDRIRQKVLVSTDYHIYSYSYDGKLEGILWSPNPQLVVVSAMEVMNDNPYCCSVHGTPGCLDANVASCVCQHRPQCCTEGWNQACVDAVEEHRCGNCRTGPCCRAHGQKGCVDRNVTECVCTLRHQCCTEQWTEECVQLVDASGCGVCSSNCCYDHQVPGCSDRAVSDCVCQFDPFCCEATWDASCVLLINKHDCGTCA